METKRAGKILAVALSSAVIAVYGCGGGGGGGGGGTAEKTPATLTSDNASVAAAGVMQALSLNQLTELTPTAAAGMDGKVRVGNKGPLRKILNATLSVVKNERVGARAPGTSGSQTTPCAGPDGILSTADDSGNVTVNVSWTNQTDTDVENLRGTVTFSNCVEGTATFNGTESIAFTGWLSAPAGMTMSANMTFVDTKGTDTITDDDNLSLSNLSASLTGITRDPVTGEITAATMSISGTVSGMQGGKAINLGFDRLTLSFANVWDGEEVSISGSLYVPCVGGWVTITTVAPVHTTTGSTCPDAGVVTIASGGNTVEVDFAPSCEVTVKFNVTTGGVLRNYTGLKGLCN